MFRVWFAFVILQGGRNTAAQVVSIFCLRNCNAFCGTSELVTVIHISAHLSTHTPICFYETFNSFPCISVIFFLKSKQGILCASPRRRSRQMRCHLLVFSSSIILPTPVVYLDLSFISFIVRASIFHVPLDARTAAAPAASSAAATIRGDITARSRQSSSAERTAAGELSLQYRYGCGLKLIRNILIPKHKVTIHVSPPPIGHYLILLIGVHNWIWGQLQASICVQVFFFIWDTLPPGGGGGWWVLCNWFSGDFVNLYIYIFS